MSKRIFAMFILVCTVLVMVCGCESKKKITAGEAVSIVAKDLGTDVESMGQPHIHSGTYSNQACFNIYVTVNGISYEYVVSVFGEILHKDPGEHSH